MNPHGWAFYSWQNITAAFVMLLWTVAIGYVCRRTPLESIMPNLDRRLVGLREDREAEVAVVGEGR
jgi:hypothetical protein